MSVAALGASASAAHANPVSDENARPGDGAWQAAVKRVAPASVVEGYASSVSVAPGGRIAFYVHSSAHYRVEIDRLGWYGGVGGRRVACLPACNLDRGAQSQPGPPAPDPHTGMVDAHWTPTDTLSVPADWVSGYYLAEFVVTRGRYTGDARSYPFVVLAPSSRAAAMLVQVPVNTWQAYNNWGGKSLYAFNSTHNRPATTVSFNRPFAAARSPVLAWEYQWVRFLERDGFDVAYATDADVDSNPAELQRHALDVSVGHDEYWTMGMRDAFVGARDAGHNLAFLGADVAEWQTRYGAGRRQLIEYRSASADPEPDPELKTIEFKKLPRPLPSCQLLGVQYEGGSISTRSRALDYRVVGSGLSDPWMRSTGFDSASTVSRVVGYEWDGVVPGCAVPPLTRFFTRSGSRPADAVAYTAASGARVFSTGSLQFVGGLDPYATDSTADPRLQRFTLNALAGLGGAPAGTPGPQGTAQKLSCRVRTAERIVRRRRGHSARRSAQIVVRVRCNEAAAVRVRARAPRVKVRCPRRGAPHRRCAARLRPATARARANRLLVIRLRLSPAVAAALGRHPRLVVTISARGATGTVTRTQRLTLRRP